MTDEQRQIRRMEALVANLRDPKHRRRRQHTLQVLAELWDRRHICIRIGPQPRIPPSVDALRAVGLCLDDPKLEVRIAAMVALTWCEPHFDEALPILEAGCRDPHPLVRLNAARSLSRLRAHAAGAVPTLRSLLSDPVRTVRWVAAFSLAECAPSEECVPILVDSLWSRSSFERLRSVVAFRGLGPLAWFAIPQLLHMMEQRGENELGEVAELLCELARDGAPGLSEPRVLDLREAARARALKDGPEGSK
ncbi:HEAT repeat domain-containing protein [Archangium lipolyticum]|uniref:HEAT repeat domain-containing protein n=1 Tax=Archangium lipolyticum TaxID=2970465 RepID=UPI0027D4644E|nr:HEAT repeat domain-containing protein [Archangium lipolyticum]